MGVKVFFVYKRYFVVENWFCILVSKLSRLIHINGKLYFCTTLFVTVRKRCNNLLRQLRSR